MESQKYLTLTLQSGAQSMFVTLPTFFLGGGGTEQLNILRGKIITTHLHGRINLTQNTTL